MFFGLAQPNIPEPDPSTVNDAVTENCLIKISSRYDSGYLTYFGHFKGWYYQWVDRMIGLNDSPQSHYLASYFMLEQAVECYIRFSGKKDLNMSLSPTEFEATFNLIAKFSGINERLREQ